MKIFDAIFVAGNSAFYFDDQAAIKQGAKQDGFVYEGKPLTQNFNVIRQPGESISILLVLENGMVAKGDCVAVQYSGAGGRDPLFISKTYLPFLEQHLKPLLVGMDVSRFLTNSKFFDQIRIDGLILHTAIRYGVSQALLDATAIANRCLKTEVVCHEYGLPLPKSIVPIFGQSGDDRYTAVDKMILKNVDTLPHALINNIEQKMGYQGEKLLAYIIWLKKRILQFNINANADYHPNIHIDVYGTIGVVFGNDANLIATYIEELQKAAEPFNLYIEGPVDAGNRKDQITLLKNIKQVLQTLNSNAKIVADEWCNTFDDITAFVDAGCCHMVQIKTPDLGCIHNVVEAILYCKMKQVEAYQGGTCNETEISAQVCVHLALASQPALMLAKPGMGFDEGMTIVSNEMQRSLAVLQAKTDFQQLDSFSYSTKLSTENYYENYK